MKPGAVRRYLTVVGIILVVFVIPADAHVDSLRIKPPFDGTGGLEYRFR